MFRVAQSCIRRALTSSQVRQPIQMLKPTYISPSFVKTFATDHHASHAHKEEVLLKYSFVFNIIKSYQY